MWPFAPRILWALATESREFRREVTNVRTKKQTFSRYFLFFVPKLYEKLFETFISQSLMHFAHRADNGCKAR